MCRVAIRQRRHEESSWRPGGGQSKPRDRAAGQDTRTPTPPLASPLRSSAPASRTARVPSQRSPRPPSTAVRRSSLRTHTGERVCISLELARLALSLGLPHFKDPQWLASRTTARRAQLRADASLHACPIVSATCIRVAPAPRPRTYASSTLHCTLSSLERARECLARHRRGANHENTPVTAAHVVAHVRTVVHSMTIGRANQEGRVS
ncbi:hypothetical protein OH76DRAFT_538014 [Lentinus brumalis]|uniref:Uncharacterized protein n=1 Tax=Lentinus brumalis TaxID=2498619 RepID=A0A371CHN9_9APHY|nr:hypothetical protein OH76DRAFT_538014 [Polyporus brumalis]